MKKLSNEPVAKAVGVLAIIQATFAILAILNVITADQAVEIGLVITGLGAPTAVGVARSQTYGPVTFERATNPDTHPPHPDDER